MQVVGVVWKKNNKKKPLFPKVKLNFGLLHASDLNLNTICSFQCTVGCKVFTAAGTNLGTLLCNHRHFYPKISINDKLIIQI